MNLEKFLKHEILKYEISACPCPLLFSWRWTQELASSYYAWKTKRKFKRYLAYKNYTSTTTP